MGSRTPVVLDTNVLVSAIGWRGNEHQLYERCRSGDPQLAISMALLEELQRVLRYPKFDLGADEIETFLADITGHALIVSPDQTLAVITEDPDDDRVLECAVAARARMIVSGDRHLLERTGYEGIRIVDAETTLTILSGV